MQTVLITGSSGLIGKHLTALLQNKGYRVIHLSRNAASLNGVQTFVWDVRKKIIDDEAVKQADYIIHLAGAGIADQRWTEERKKEVIDSRTESTKLLFESIQRCKPTLKAFVAASAIGYYGAVTDEKMYSENDPPAPDFMGTTCRLWEAAVEPVAQLGIRTLKIRIGIVLAAEDGALKQMITPIKLGIGSPLGSGKQWVSWIHINDVCAIFLKALEDEKMQGAYNAAAPHPVTNKQLMKAIAKSLHKPFFFPNVPAFLLKLIFGKMAEMFLEGSRVSSEKIEHAGFKFQYEQIDEAMNSLMRKK